MGYKRFPVLAGHQPFHAVKGMVTDYMHCVLLGVTKTLLKLWMDTGNCEKGFYIGRRYTFAKNLIVSSLRVLKHPGNHVDQ